MGLRFPLLASAVSAASLPNSALRIIPFGDSRADLTFGNSGGPDVHNGTSFTLGGSVSSCSALAYLPLLLPDACFSANGGQSSDKTWNWDSATRPPNGRTHAACLALGGDVMVIQYGTNDFMDVTDTTTRDSIRAQVVGELQALITATIAAGIKVVWETTFQRTSAGYTANQALRQECCDLVNSDMLTWIATQDQTMVRASDLRAATNTGGVTSGAYLRADYADAVGAHLNFTGAMATNAITAAQIRALFPARGLVPMYRATGTNLIHTVSAATVLGVTANNCTLNSTSYADVDGKPAVTFLVTPGGVSSSFLFQIHADVGSNGGRTPQNTFAAGEKLKSQFNVVIDNGSGGAPSANNFWTNFYITYTGGPAEQRVQNRGPNESTGAFTAAIDKGRVITIPVTTTNGSASIGAPSSGTGMRIMVLVYAPAGGAQYRIRIVDPQIRAVT